MAQSSTLQTIRLPISGDLYAPDGSEIRLLPVTERGSLCHCTLPSGETSRAISHRKVEEIWYVIEGKGVVWRRSEAAEPSVSIAPGTSLTIPAGCAFQFRNIGSERLCILIITMPPWPGPDEAVLVAGAWQASA
jgi:mannose-6-phosphate isomerase-like protein (cupin superfamily)